MRFQKFNDFLKEREFSESNDFDTKLVQFNARFDDPKQALEIVQAADYSSVRAFLNCTDKNKWSKLKIPGQENYSR